MAEIWIGSTQNGRQNGQLQNSCPQCRRYFEHLLCDAGNQARVNPHAQHAPNPVPNRGF